jgi:hypothetical protein
MRPVRFDLIRFVLAGALSLMLRALRISGAPEQGLAQRAASLKSTARCGR